MPRHLMLTFDAPLMSFGGDMVDAYGVVRDFPARSLITGLIANALGWDRTEGGRHEALQARIRFGAVRVQEGQRVRDFQTAQLGAGDRGWTTRGKPEGRTGGPDTYRSPHIRYRDADADASVVVALRFEPADAEPSLDAVANALDHPARPLFIGRKPFLPSGPIANGFLNCPDVPAALALALAEGASARGQWDTRDCGSRGSDRADRTYDLTETRNWLNGVHAGLSRMTEGRIVRPAA
jgi:CRISPR system Cascade subunit CasD